MRISANGTAIVKAFEGCLKPILGRPGMFKPYICPAGVLTIGWGHTNHHPPKFTANAVWSQRQCDEVLDGDMQRFENRVKKILAGVVLRQHEFDALVSFDYNTGGLDRSSIPAKIRSGRRHQVRETLARWNKSKKRVLPGLVRRREAEADLFEGKIDEALRTAGAVRYLTKEPMPQAVDRPKPPVSQAIKQTVGPGTAVTVGGGTAAAASFSLWPAVLIGLAVLGVIAVLVIVKRKELDSEWA